MFRSEIMAITMEVLNILGVLFVCLLGLGVIALIIMYFVDRFQSRHTIRRNYPVIGRFRYFFEHMGEFFRQYFFAMDREDLVSAWVGARLKVCAT